MIPTNREWFTVSTKATDVAGVGCAAPAGSVIDLLKRMRVHREMMAQHQRTRLQGAMFIESIKMIERLSQALDCIADYGGKTVDTECGEITCSGSWCAEQARCAISQNDQSLARRASGSE